MLHTLECFTEWHSNRTIALPAKFAILHLHKRLYKYLMLKSTEVQEKYIQNSSEKRKLFVLYQKSPEIPKHSHHNFCYSAFLPVHWSFPTFLYIYLNPDVPNINNTKSWSKGRIIHQGPRMISITRWSSHPLHSSFWEGCVILGWSGAIFPSSPN